MIRTLNFTGRKRLVRENARITTRQSVSGIVEFDAELDFGGLELPAAAPVFVEAVFKTTFMRFAWGTVGRLVPADDRRLTRLEQPQLAHFRVKVVEPATDGFARLLAVADRLEPEGMCVSGKRRVSLFRVSCIDSLEHEIWRLNFDDAGGPLLELQRSVPGIKQLIRQEAFMALVFPQLVRQILVRVFKDGCYDPEENPDTWQARWLRFAQKLVNRTPPELVDGEVETLHDEWIDEVVFEFSRQQKLVAKFKKRFAVVEADST